MNIYKYRWLIIVLFLAVAFIMARNIPNNSVDGDVTNYIPETMESRVNTEALEDLFGGSDILLVMLGSDDIINEQSLKRLKKLTREFKKQNGVDKVLSLFEMKDIRGEEDMMIVDPAVRRIPKTPKDIEKLKSQLRDNDIVYGSMVSEDFTKTVIVLVMEEDADDTELIFMADSLLLEFPGDEEVLIGGIPFIRAKLPVMIGGDMRILMPAAILLMLIMLFIEFRRWRGMVLPFLIVIISIMFTLGLMSVLDWKFTISSILIPIMLIAVANNYGIHLVANYQELNTTDNKASNREIVSASLKELWKPILITGLTTVAGLLGLLSHQVIPSKQMGIVTSAGIIFALVASLLLLPAILYLFKKEKPLYKDAEQKRNLMDRLLNKLGKFVVNKPKPIIIGTIVVTLGLGVGLAFIGLDANPVSYFKTNNPIRIADKVLNENFGGTQQLAVLFEGDIKDPALLKRMDSYVAELETMEGVGSITCISEMIKEMSKALNDEGDLYYNKIPDTREAVAQYLELYMMSGDPDDFEKIVDFDYQNAQMIVRINDASTPVLAAIKDKIESYKQQDASIGKMGGFALVVMELGNVMINGQIMSIILAIVIIFIIMTLLFKSLRAGVLGVIPLVVSIVILFGLMGLLGMTINMGSALLSSIVIGIGVDYTIHFMWRYRAELKNYPKEYAKAVMITLNTTGRGIVFNAVAVMVGFVVLMSSNFIPIIQFGYLIVFSIFTCLIGALVLVPAICLLWKPAFIEK